MRKILISVLIVILIILAYFTIFQGISIGSFKILGINQISELNSKLIAKRDEANTKVITDLQNKKQEVLDSVDNLLNNKESYYKSVNSSTESELTEATTEDVYNAEYLYLKIGGYAREKGVKWRMDIKADENEESDIKELAFSITGKYQGIIDFISALEDDNELKFRIEDFKLVPNEENLQATFNVRNVMVKLDETNQTIDSSDEGQVENIEQ